MKIRISIILMIVVLMINSTVSSSTNNYVFTKDVKGNIYNNVMEVINTNKLKKITHLINNTIEINYKNSIEKEEEIQKIDKVLSCDKYDDYILGESEINAKSNNEEINASIATNNGLSDINVTYIKNGIFSTKDLNKISNDFIKYSDIYNNSLIWSNTIKYEITGNDKLVLQYMNDILDSVDLTEYTHGIFGTGYLQNTKISFAITNYDTGSYLIIGTPIINIAY